MRCESCWNTLDVVTGQAFWFIKERTHSRFTGDLKSVLQKCTHSITHKTINLTFSSVTLNYGRLSLWGWWGAVGGSGWRPLASFSRKLCHRERKSSTFDGELSGFFLAIRHFCFTLEGRRVTAFTDREQLTFATGKFSEPWSGWQQRQLSSISESTNDIQHEARKVVAVSVHLGQAMNSEAQAYHWIPTMLNMEEVVSDVRNQVRQAQASRGTPGPGLHASTWRYWRYGWQARLNLYRPSQAWSCGCQRTAAVGPAPIVGLPAVASGPAPGPFSGPAPVVFECWHLVTSNDTPSVCWCQALPEPLWTPELEMFCHQIQWSLVKLSDSFFVCPFNIGRKCHLRARTSYRDAKSTLTFWVREFSLMSKVLRIQKAFLLKSFFLFLVSLEMKGEAKNVNFHWRFWLNLLNQ